MKELTAENVEKVFTECFFKEGEDTSKAVLAEGVMHNVGFHPERLEAHKVEIADFLDQLPSPFKKEVGGGWSFMNACETSNGRQWGEHRSIEQLLLLGLAAGLVEYGMHRELWVVLPGGVPYFAVLPSATSISELKS